jgi:hypothetical protein
MRTISPAHFADRFATPRARIVWWWALGLALALWPAVHTSEFHELASTSLVPGAPVAGEHASVHEGLVTLGPGRETPAQATWQVAISRLRWYRVDLTLDNRGTAAPARLDVEFHGVGYEWADRVASLIVPPDVQGYHARALLRAEDTPGDIALRVRYRGGATVSIGDVELRRIDPVDRAVRIAALLTLALVCVAGIGVWAQTLVAALVRARVQEWPLSLAWAAGIALVVVAGFIGVSMIGAPQIFSDEYGYTAATVAMHLGNWPGPEASVYGDAIPNRLFFALYVPAAGAIEPWIVARSLNVTWLGVGALLIAIAAHRAALRASGLVVLLAFGLGPLGSYTAYFMPETLFQSTFIALCLAAVWLLRSTSMLPAIVFGIVAAALPLVRPHGWIGVIVAFAFVGWVIITRGDSVQNPGKLKLAIALAAVAIASFALRATLVVNPMSDSLFGRYSVYAAFMRETIANPALYPKLLQLFALHIGIVMTLTGPALPAGLCEALRRREPSARTPAEQFAADLVALAGVALVAYVALTAVFCVAISQYGGEPFYRLHTRYYSFAVPLLVLGFLGSPTWREWSAASRARALLLWCVACVATLATLRPFFWTIVDAPDLWPNDLATPIAIAAIAAAAIVIAFGLRRRANGARVAVMVAYGFAAIVSGVAARATQVSWQELAEDRAARVAAALVRQTDVPLVVVGEPAEGWLYRVAAYAPASAVFAPPERVTQTLGGAPTGTVVVDSNAGIATRMLDPVAQFSRFMVARLRNSHAGQAADMP